MKIIFFGNTKYSNIGLRIINSIYPISLVITLSKSPVKKTAEELKIPFLETNKLTKDVIDKVAKFKPDFLIVEDYGLILPNQLLLLPIYASLNIHHSLLPKYRGSSPAPMAILNGDHISGVTVIKMTDKVDKGPILAQQAYTLSEKEATNSLLIKLNELGGKLVVTVIEQYLKGTHKETPQPPSPTPYTPRFTRQTGYFDINNPPTSDKLDRMIRAYFPWPGVWTRWKDKIVKFLPGDLLQMEGKKAIPCNDFLNGYPDFPLKQMQVE